MWGWWSWREQEKLDDFWHGRPKLGLTLLVVGLLFLGWLLWREHDQATIESIEKMMAWIGVAILFLIGRAIYERYFGD